MLTSKIKSSINSVIHSVIFILTLALSGISYSACIMPDGIIGKDGKQLTQEFIGSIKTMKKGDRPMPEKYLDSHYVGCHRDNFSNGASRLVKKEVYEKYGVGKNDTGKTEFVSTKENIDRILDESAGNRAAISERLGLPEEALSGKIIRIDFISTEKYAPEIPSGNERGANDQWEPGGKLPNGELEAIIKTEGMAKDVDYTVTELDLQP